MFAMLKTRCVFSVFMFLIIFMVITIFISVMIKWKYKDGNIITDPQMTFQRYKDGNITSDLQVTSCRNVLETMIKGTWVERPHTQQELESVERFISSAQQVHFLPATMQRTDGRCGNVTFDELTGRWNKLLWFRALCDPKGLVPCCYNNVCTSRPKENCKCPNCYDLRQPIHAELATWVPSDPTCKITRFDTVKDACRLLQNMTIYMFGDSLIRHIYIPLLTILRKGKTYGSLREATAPNLVARCKADYALLGKCMFDIDGDTWECNNTVRLLFKEHAFATQTNITLQLITELIGRSNSMVFIGIGIHDDYNYPEVVNKLLLPLIKNLSTSPWPKLVWSAAHAPGLMKTPRVPSQSRESVVIYNKQLRSILDAHHVPVFDTFQLTDGVASFDGVHYGGGVNKVKAQIFLNYLLQLRSNGEFPFERTPNLKPEPEMKIS